MCLRELMCLPKFSPKLASLVFLDTAQDCSLRKCLTSSRDETSNKKKKKSVTQIRA